MIRNCTLEVYFFCLLLSVFAVPVTASDPMTLGQHMSLAGDNLVNMLNPQKDYLAYWMMRVDDEYRADLWFRKSCDAHNIGRWWDAMLRLEAATGYKIPKDAEAGMLRNFWRYTDNPWGILLDVDDNPDDAANWYIHSFRETMLTYAALVRYRKSDRAAEAGSRAVRAMARACADPRRADFSPTKQPINKSHPVYFHGRAIEGLVLFHKATGDKASLELAGRLAEYHMQNMTSPDGGRGKDISHHSHSYLNTLRVPGWALAVSLKLLVDGKAAPIRRQGAYVVVPGSPDGLRVELRYALPLRTTTETSRNQYFYSPQRKFGPAAKPYTYTLHWRGDEVVKASPVGDYFPLYPSIDTDERTISNDL